jgi:hypothetical protein
MLPPLLFMRQVQRFMLRDAAGVRYAPICGRRSHETSRVATARTPLPLQ